MLIKEGAVDTFGQYNNVVNPIQPIKSRVSTLREGERPELGTRMESSIQTPRGNHINMASNCVENNSVKGEFYIGFRRFV